MQILLGKKEIAIFKLHKGTLDRFGNSGNCSLNFEGEHFETRFGEIKSNLGENIGLIIAKKIKVWLLSPSSLKPWSYLTSGRS